MAVVVPIAPSTPETGPRSVSIPEGVEILPTSPHENFGNKSEKNTLNWKKDVKLRYRVMAWFANKAYNILDTFVHLDEKLAKANDRYQKHIREIVETGPDEDERLIFAARDAFGVFRKHDGEPVSAERVKRARKRARFSMPRIQALAAYEIGKLGEHEQEEGWQRIVDIMYKDLGFTRHEVFNVMIGLQFMNKAKYLTFKHRKLEHPPLRDANGKVIKEFVPSVDSKGNLQYEQVQTGVDDQGKPIMKRRLKGTFETKEDHSRLVLGKLNVRAYVTELAAKFETYRYSFNPADMATLVIAVKELRKLCDDMVTMKENETAEDVQARVNLPEFRDSLYALNAISMAIEGSKMGGSTDTEGELTDQAAMLEQQRIETERARQNYVTDEHGKLKDSTINELKAGNWNDQYIAEFSQNYLKPRMTPFELMSAINVFKTEKERQGVQIRIDNMKAVGKPLYPPRIPSSAEANILWQQVANEIDLAKETYGPWMNKVKAENFVKNVSLKVGSTGIEGRYEETDVSAKLHEKAANNVVKLRRRPEEEENNSQQPPLRRAV
jgi:hypothetical protein